MNGLLLSLVATLLPVQDPSPTPAGGDVVVLRSGEELRGTLLLETSAYLEIRVGSDTTVGIERSDVREVKRGVAPAVEPKAAAPAPAFAPADSVPADVPTPIDSGYLAARDEWFVLHDGEGRCVGTLHATVRNGEEGDLKIAEEWDFVIERARMQVTQMETLARNGVPLACFYHERTHYDGERHPRAERLVRGTLARGTLQVVRTGERGSANAEYAVGEGLLFPLTLRELLRQRPGSVGSQGRKLLFDAAHDELAQCDFVSNLRRRVEFDGAVVAARETRVGVGARASAEWIDGNGRTLRREVSGPALVAVRSARDMALAMVASKAKAFPAAVLRETEGRFSLWLPNSTWRFDGEQSAGQVTAHAPIYDASVSAMVLDQLRDGAHLGMAGDIVERWLRAVCRDFKVRVRQTVEVRGAAALELEGSYQRALDDRSVRCEVCVLVLRPPDGPYLALCFAAPASDHDALRPDFARMVESLELHPAAVAAEAKPGPRKVTPR